MRHHEAELPLDFTADGSLAEMFGFDQRKTDELGQSSSVRTLWNGSKRRIPGEIRVMGNCAPVSSAKGGQQQWLRTAKVIRADGKMEEYETAVPAGRVVARSPGYYVCSGEAMQVGARPPVVGEGEQLQPGQLYFLLPLSYSRRPLSLPDLCLFAAKASAALRQPSSLACNAHAVRGHQFCVSSSLIEQQQKPFLA
ncbi:hypothetical protein BHE74_00017045 [Ensete ventricosum]|nr:hypothetical protein BHE74_00017045 [Ensete ventricosum]